MRKIVKNCLPLVFSFIVLSSSQLYSQVVRFAVIGDFGDRYSTTSEHIADSIATWNVDFILALGENNYYNDTSLTPIENMDLAVGKNYHEWIYPYVGPYFSNPPDSTTNRFFPTVGNHDYYIPDSGLTIQGYLDYFDLTPYSTTSGTETYYNYRWNDLVELFILDNYDGNKPDDIDGGSFQPDGWWANEDSTSVQAQWLQTQMAASTAKWKIVSIHYPPYSSAKFDASPHPSARWDFKGMGANVVFSANYGNYERLLVDDLLYIVNGTGGHKPFAAFGTPDPNSQKRLRNESGAVLVELNNTQMTLKFIADEGVILDSYTTDYPFPVELTSFTSSIIGNKVKLQWETATEVTNYGFDIERKVGNAQSTVGQFEKIGFVDGNGNSNSPKYYSFEDKYLSNSKYSYRLKQIDTDGKYEYSKVIEVDLGNPKEYSLLQNFPNPFNPSTKIEFRIPEKQMVSLRVYNVLGEMVKNLINEEREAGSYSVTFDGTGLPSGIYIYRLETDNYVANRKMSFLK